MVQLQQFNDVKYPRRRPWILVVLLLAVAGFFWLRSRRGDEAQAPPSPEPAPAVIENQAPSEGKAPVHSIIDDMDLKVLLTDAEAFEKQGDMAAARKCYLAALAKSPTQDVTRQIEDHLGPLNAALVLSPRPMPEKLEYIVKSGDYLGKIARNFKTTVELIQESNDLANPNVIKKGDRLAILQGTFSIVVNKSANELTLFFNDKFFRRYAVGTGKHGKTPEGTFKVTQKTPEPVWWRPDGKEVPYGDPENILGTHWMAIRATGDTPDARGYGIHGTWDESSIGKPESAGCVRMRNKEVEELFTLVPAGTKVVVAE